MIKSIDPDLCFGCGDCDASCPMDVIYVGLAGEGAEIRYPQDCMTCYSCEVECRWAPPSWIPSRARSPRPGRASRGLVR